MRGPGVVVDFTFRGSSWNRRFGGEAVSDGDWWKFCGGSVAALPLPSNPHKLKQAQQHDRKCAASYSLAV
jgi:hypothetical protein